MAEKSGVIPMFDTITPSSSGETILRMRSSTFATSASVTEIRRPEGALRLITNMPAWVRGKKDKPTWGKNRAKLTTNVPIHAATVSRGQRSAPPTNQSYIFRKPSNRSLNQTLTRSPIPQWFFLLLSSTSTGISVAGVPWCAAALINMAQYRGTTVIATMYEAAKARTTARANAENKNWLAPERKKTGKKTTAVFTVAAR